MHRVLGSETARSANVPAATPACSCIGELSIYFAGPAVLHHCSRCRSHVVRVGVETGARSKKCKVPVTVGQSMITELDGAKGTGTDGRRETSEILLWTRLGAPNEQA